MLALYPPLQIERPAFDDIQILRTLMKNAFVDPLTAIFRIGDGIENRSDIDRNTFQHPPGELTVISGCLVKDHHRAGKYPFIVFDRNEHDRCDPFAHESLFVLHEKAILSVIRTLCRDIADDDDIFVRIFENQTILLFTPDHITCPALSVPFVEEVDFRKHRKGTHLTRTLKDLFFVEPDDHPVTGKRIGDIFAHFISLVFEIGVIDPLVQPLQHTDRLIDTTVQIVLDIAFRKRGGEFE